MLKKYIERYKRKKFRKAKLPQATKREEDLIDAFRKKVQSLDPIPSTNLDSLKAWNQNRMDLRKSISQSDPRKFLTWDVIRRTMYCEAKAAEFDAIKSKNYLKNATTASVGRAYPFAGSHLDENTVHHLYNVSFLLDQIQDFSKIQNIIEFGGGYGNTCRLIYDLGFNGEYTIFDLPEFSYLQEYFLKSHSTTSSQNSSPIPFEESITLFHSLKQLKTHVERFDWDKTLFIATWSLSECNLNLRDEFLDGMSPSYYFIAYQSQFGEVDNTTYFQHLREVNRHLNWVQTPINHLKNDFYLVGTPEK